MAPVDHCGLRINTPSATTTEETGKTNVEASLMPLQIVQKSSANFDEVFSDRPGGALAGRLNASTKIADARGAMPVLAK